VVSSLNVYRLPSESLHAVVISHMLISFVKKCMHFQVTRTKKDNIAS